MPEPVAGARVGLLGVPTYLPLGPLPRGIVATDRRGNFKLGGLPEPCCLTAAMGVSGFYVRNGCSPTLPELCSFLTQNGA